MRGPLRSPLSPKRPRRRLGCLRWPPRPALGAVGDFRHRACSGHGADIRECGRRCDLAARGGADQRELLYPTFLRRTSRRRHRRDCGSLRLEFIVTSCSGVSLHGPGARTALSQQRSRPHSRPHSSGECSPDLCGADCPGDHCGFAARTDASRGTLAGRPAGPQRPVVGGCDCRRCRRGRLFCLLLHPAEHASLASRRRNAGPRSAMGGPQRAWSRCCHRRSGCVLRRRAGPHPGFAPHAHALRGNRLRFRRFDDARRISCSGWAAALFRLPRAREAPRTSLIRSPVAPVPR